jgi:hypothetical protein
MNRVNCRELLEQVRDRDHWLRGEFPDIDLAARVEKVLERVDKIRWWESPMQVKQDVERLLNGEKP